MPDRNNHSGFLALLEAVIDGKLPAIDASAGMPPVVGGMFDIAGKLGRLGRGHTIEFEPDEAGMLFDIIDDAVDLILEGKAPTKLHEKIARRLSDLAFELGSAMSWAFNLSAIRDGLCSGTIEAGASSGDPHRRS